MEPRAEVASDVPRAAVPEVDVADAEGLGGPAAPGARGPRGRLWVGSDEGFVEVEDDLCFVFVFVFVFLLIQGGREAA